LSYQPPLPPDPASQASSPPYSSPSGDPPAPEGLAPTPTYRPGYARPPAPSPDEGYPPTSQFPAYDAAAEGSPAYPPPGYQQPGYGTPGYGPPPAAPRRSNAPLIAVVVAVALLLCGGVATAGVLVGRNVTDRAKAVKPIIDRPTTAAGQPGGLTHAPTGAPNLPGLPTDSNGDPYLPDGSGGKTITVVYEVTGDGPADIVYTLKLGDAPKRVTHATLPWRVQTSMTGAAFVSVVAVRGEIGSGSISCRATVDGKEVAKHSHSGAFAVASCTKMILD
jgi:hypothetical protein